MGCGCSKRPGGVLQEDRTEDQRIKVLYTSKRSSFASGRLNYVEVIGDGGSVMKERDAKLRSNGVANPKPRDDGRELGKQWRTGQMPQNPNPNPRLSNPPKHLEGECVAAGWPSWLSSVAGEAVKGWIPRRADSFEKLDKIGQGTYSNVYKARDLETGKIVALKKVRFDNLEPESVRFMAREIQVLRRLDHPNIVKLEGLVTSRMSCSLYLVFEYMEHDLAGLAASPGTKFSEPQVKYYMQQLLKGLDHCHRRGVLHRDIKGSNLLLDNSGVLKIADFGLATFFSQDQRQALTSRVVTLWYRPPELLLGATEYGVGVDLWSTGCILAELLAGKPIMPGRTEVEQLHKIFKLCGSPSEDYWRKSKLPHATIFKPKQPYKRCIATTFRDFPPSSLSSLETLLAIEPADRGTAAEALESEFFTTKPFACDPSSLPKYPPSKEFDAKLRDEEARRQRAAGLRVQMQQGGGDDRSRASKAWPAPDANAELPASIQKRRLASHSVKSQSEKFNPRLEDSAVGFPIDPPRLPDDENKPVANGKGLRKQGEAKTQSMDFSRPPVQLTSAYRSNSSKSSAALPHSRQREGVQSHSRHNSKQHAEAASKPAAELHRGASRAQHERPGSGRQATDRVHFSGPLLHPSVNVEDILGQHERQIQQAVRRSRQDKAKDKNHHHHHQQQQQQQQLQQLRSNSGRSSAAARNAWPGMIAQEEHGSMLSRSGRWKQSRTQSGREADAMATHGLAALIERPEREHDC